MAGCLRAQADRERSHDCNAWLTVTRVSSARDCEAFLYCFAVGVML